MYSHSVNYQNKKKCVGSFKDESQITDIACFSLNMFAFNLLQWTKGFLDLYPIRIRLI